MPIYEYYCAANHRIYQFYAKTLAQGRTVPRCPEHPQWKMEKILSRFAVASAGKDREGGGQEPGAGSPGAGDGVGDPAEDARMEAAMGAMEREFSSVDENDPRAMGRMMRRMSELTGEKIDGEMEEVVRKLEEGADPESLEEQFGGEEGGADDPSGDGPGGGAGPKNSQEPRARPKVRRAPPTRDPKLYDYE